MRSLHVGDLRPFGPGPTVLPAQAWQPLPRRGRPVAGLPARVPSPSQTSLSGEDQAVPGSFLPQQERAGPAPRLDPGTAGGGGGEGRRGDR